MNFYADQVGTAMIDVDQLPWIPFLPYSDQVFIKLIKLNPINGEWTSLLKVPGGAELNVDVAAFVSGFEDGQQPDVPRLLWEMLREAAFVPDFRPDPDDSLSQLYAMGPEEVRDDVIEPLLTKLGLSVSGIYFTSFDFSSIATPRDVVAFVIKVVDAQNGERPRFLDLCRDRDASSAMN